MTSEFYGIPSTQSLIAFDAVARHRSFRRAAEELCITDSAISHRIRELERNLGTLLFERTTRSACLTMEGDALLKSIVPALMTLQSATSSFKERRMRVRLSILPSFARFWLLPRLSGLQHALPDITLDIDTTLRKVQFDQNEADLAIRFCRDPGSEGLAVTKIMDDEWIPVATPKYAASLGEGDLQQRLRRATLVEHQRQPWSPWFEQAKLEPPGTGKLLLLSDTAMMVDAALQNVGVALVRRSLVDRLIRSGDLEVLFDIGLKSESSYFIICKKRSLSRRAIADVYGWLIDSIQNDEADAE